MTVCANCTQRAAREHFQQESNLDPTVVHRRASCFVNLTETSKKSGRLRDTAEHHGPAKRRNAPTDQHRESINMMVFAKKFRTCLAFMAKPTEASHLTRQPNTRLTAASTGRFLGLRRRPNLSHAFTKCSRPDRWTGSSWDTFFLKTTSRPSRYTHEISCVGIGRSRGPFTMLPGISATRNAIRRQPRHGSACRCECACVCGHKPRWRAKDISKVPVLRRLPV